MNAQPAPMVSGSHFFPAAPLLCTKLMPACLVISRNVTCAADVEARTAHRSSKKKKDLCMAFMGSVICPALLSRAARLPLQVSLPAQAEAKHVRESVGVRCC